VKKKLLSFAQLLLGVGIVAHIVFNLHRRGDLHKLSGALQSAAHHWPLLAVGVAMFGGCIFFCTARWAWLLDAQGLHMPFRRVFALYFVGQFFNAFMFGTTGGDVVKAYYVARETHHRKTEIAATVFIDRIIGLIALILLALGVIAVRLPFFLGSPVMRGAMLFNLVAFVGAAGGLAVILTRNLLLRYAFFRRLEERTKLGQIAGRAYAAFHTCLSDPRLLAKTLLISLVNHLSCVVAVFYLGMAIGLPLSFIDYLTVFPTINAVAAIPVTPGGLGTRETAAIHILGVLAVPAAKALTVSLLLYSTVMLWSMLGGLVYVVFAWKKGPAAAEMPVEGDP
jgi:glycosyltransferase 2 family protein